MCIIDQLQVRMNEWPASILSRLVERGLTVKNKVLFAFVSGFLLCVIGCGGGEDKPIAVAKPAEIPPSRMMTLSQEQLLSLDWHSPHRRGARIVGQRAAGSGVEFDIDFPSNDPGDTSLDFVSSGDGGRGDLIGGDISGFRSFALKLTLVSINGQSEPAMKQRLAAGAVIGPTASGLVHTYSPVVLSMADSERTVIATTPSRADNIRTIGFHVDLLEPRDWDPSGSEVILRVEPAEGGGIAPWFPPVAAEGQSE